MLEPGEAEPFLATATPPQTFDGASPQTLITITGNHAFGQRQVINAMKNLHPYGIPHSILFENMFAKTYDAAKLDEDGERIRQFYTDHGYFQAK